MLVDIEVSDIIRSNGMKQITAKTWWLNKYYIVNFMTKETKFYDILSVAQLFNNAMHFIFYSAPYTNSVGQKNVFIS